MTGPGSEASAPASLVHPTDADEAAFALAAGARVEGRDVLLEPEGLALLAALGFETPHGVVVDGPGGLPDLDDFPGARVVVKLLSPQVLHRTEVGGVRVVARESHQVVRAVEELAANSGDPGARYLIQEFVPHEAETGGELLLGARWSAEFGPVVTLALGGVSAEAVAAAAGGDALGFLWSSTALAEADVVRDLSGTLGDLFTGSVRGREPRVTREGLARAVVAFARGVDGWMPLHFHDVEVNPLAFRNGRPVALDALVRLAPAEDTPETSAAADVARTSRSDGPAPSPRHRQGMEALLHPTTVAVVGASARGMNPGRVILRNVLAAGMDPDSVQVVKDGIEELDGCRCVPDVASLEPVDALMVSIAAAQVPPLLEEVVEGGKARGVVLTSGGLGEGESGTEGARRVREALARPGAPALNGGNCLGIRSVPGRCDSLFIPPEKLGFPGGTPHRVAVVSQSGAFAIARASGLPWLNPRYLITVGNQLDLTVGAWLEHLVDEPDLDVVGCYVEGFRPGDGHRFLQAVRAHRRRGRMVILYRGGRTAEGQEATRSHTASLAGDYRVTRALAVQAGALVAETSRDFSDLLGMAVRLHPRSVSGHRAGLLSNAGFECVGMADSLDGLEAATLGPPTLERLGRILDEARLTGVIAPRNPLDVTPILGNRGFVEAADALLADPGVDVGVVGCVPLTPALRTLSGEMDAGEGVAEGLVDLWRATDKAWVVALDGGPSYDALARHLTEAGIPVLRNADRATWLLGRYARSRLVGEAVSRGR